MPLIDARHIRFVLDDVWRVGEVLALPAFQAFDRAGTEQLLETAEKLAVAELLASHALLDTDEPRLENGRVVLPAAIETALNALREAGIFAMTADTAHGGLGLPRMIANAAFLWFQAANIAIANYAMLTMSAAELLAQHGTPEQQRLYMAPMLEGRFLGTMALSEPHAGSSLGDITTSARPRDDGSYALSGAKMWISGGEHDMAGNIVHLMLARIEGAAAGVKGISLFIVPRKRVASDGRVGVWNNIQVTGLNHKMGQRGTVNTALAIGDGGETIGHLVGKPGQGLACMFTMMNEARIGVSMGAVAHASAGFLHSLDYARERVQGRHPDSRDPTGRQVPLVEHADVRRMLLQQKAAAEGGIALGLLLAKLADLKKAALSPGERDDAALLLDLLTPVFKAWISEECLAANFNAMQVLGGAGYTRDHPVEQHYRDNRLNPIHEGTNGIQAIDLLGRKVRLAEGRAVTLLVAEIEASIAPRAGYANVDPALAAGVTAQLSNLQAAIHALAALRAIDGVRAELAHATDFMELVGATVFAWIWVEQARAAAAAIQRDATADRDFLSGKIATCQHVLEMYLPRAAAAAERIRSGPPTAFHMRDEWLG